MCNITPTIRLVASLIIAIKSKHKIRLECGNTLVSFWGLRLLREGSLYKQTEELKSEANGKRSVICLNHCQDQTVVSVMWLTVLSLRLKSWSVTMQMKCPSSTFFLLVLFVCSIVELRYLEFLAVRNWNPFLLILFAQLFTTLVISNNCLFPLRVWDTAGVCNCLLVKLYRRLLF